MTFESQNAHAALVKFLLDDTAGNAGAALESVGTFTNHGVTLSTTVTSTLGSMTGNFSANGSGSGVNSAGITAGDGPSELDAGETVTFTFAFSTPTTVTFSSFDFSGVGPSAGGDAALVSVNGGSDLILETGVANFNGGSDVWTPNLAFTSGATIRVNAQDTIRFEELTLDIVTAVPEPSSWAMMVMAGTCVVFCRHRRKHTATSQVVDF